MSNFTVKCPFCNKDVLIQTEYANQQLACPMCQNIFTAPSAPAAQTPSAQVQTPRRSKLKIPVSQQPDNYTPPTTYKPQMDPNYLRHLKQMKYLETSLIIIKILAIFTLISCGAFWGYQLHEEYKKSIEIKKEDKKRIEYFTQTLIPKFFQNSDNLYSQPNGCIFKEVDIKKISDSCYKADVTFSHQGNTLKRVILCRVLNYTEQPSFIAREIYPYEDITVMQQDIPIWAEKMKKKHFSNPQDWVYSAYSLIEISPVDHYVKAQISVKNKQNDETKYFVISISFDPLTGKVNEY